MCKAVITAYTTGAGILIGLMLLAHGCEANREPALSPVARVERAEALPPQRLRVINPQVLQMERYGFAVLDFSARRDDAGIVTILGEVRNNGSIPQGVELQVIVRDDNARVVAERGFWPASLENLEPGEVRPFTFPLGRFQNIAQIELRIAQVRQWD